MQLPHGVIRPGFTAGQQLRSRLSSTESARGPGLQRSHRLRHLVLRRLSEKWPRSVLLCRRNTEHELDPGVGFVCLFPPAWDPAAGALEPFMLPVPGSDHGNLQQGGRERDAAYQQDLCRRGTDDRLDVWANVCELHGSCTPHRRRGRSNALLARTHVFGHGRFDRAGASTEPCFLSVDVFCT